MPGVSILFFKARNEDKLKTNFDFSCVQVKKRFLKVLRRLTFIIQNWRIFIKQVWQIFSTLQRLQ